MAASLSQLSVLSQISEEFLLCQVCFERFNKPKILPCLHSFCEGCLQRYAPAGSRTIRCPMCKQETELPENGGVCGLKDNFFILNLSDVFTEIAPAKRGEKQPPRKAICTICVGAEPAEASFRCLECVDFLCDVCAPSHDHRLARFSRQHHVISVPASENKKLLRRDIYCDKHNSETVRFFCESCNRPICRDCVLVEHKDHSHTFLKDEVSKHKNTIDTLLHGVRDKIAAFEEAMKSVDEAEANLEANRGQAEYIINKTMQDYITQLKVQQQHLTQKLSRACEGRKKQLNAHRKSLQAGLENLLSGFDFTEKALGHGSELDILSIKDEVIDRLQGLSTISPQQDLTLDQLSQLYFVASESAADLSLPLLGEIRCGDRTFVDMSETGDSRSICSIESSELGDSSMSESIPKSPRKVVEARPLPVSKPQLLFHLKDETDEAGEFDWPSGVASSADGEYVAIVDRDNDRIQVYNRKGKFECKFGNRGRQPCQFELPLDAAITTDDDPCIYVTDEYNHRVQKLTLYGKYVSHFGDNGIFKQPYGIAITSKGHVVVTDIGKHRVTIHDPNGKLLHHFGSRGDGETQFNEPRYVAAHNDKIVVSDHCNHCIKVFNSQGAHLRTFGSCGSGNGQFIGPTGVCIDKDGNIIVADCADRVQLFNSEGVFLRHLLNEGDGLSGPLGMVITASEELVITNLGTHCVNVFKYSGWV
ncbi:tripartite motif-containing protein 3-like [Acanthaster planci]|uniref:Tripartite motif-containing protein 3-like n=1 Tax=Acanthaster planci TaxID=133434 RepID=A0A8B7Z0L7_ACAPL|nr:tripartite motif-containing protein 3-like [Acanthaster planci]